MPLSAAQETVPATPAAPSQPVAAAGSNRMVELDILRGFLLVWMTLTHMPTHVSNYSNQALGFVSAAEGFIFLAALLIGIIYIRSQQKSGSGVALRNLFRRTLRIYRYHIALLGITFAVVALFATARHWEAISNQFDFFLRAPLQASASAAALLYNPPLFDILPMYVLFMLLTPLALEIGQRWTWKPVLAISVAIWLLAQFGFREWLYAQAAPRGFWVPLQAMGAFNLFGWQLLWVGCLALASLNPLRRFEGRDLPRWMVMVAAMVAIVLFICRRSSFDTWIGQELYGHLIDKWRLGPLRMINFAAIGILLIRFGATLVRLPFVQHFALLGRSSLEVFCAHIVFCLIALAAGSGPNAQLPPAQQALALAITLPGLFVVAYVAERRRALNSESQAAAH